MPSCGEYNGSHADDEEYAKVIFSSIQEDITQDSIAMKVWSNTVQTLQHKMHWAEEIYEGMEPVDEKFVKMHIDRERIDRVVRKIVRGLFFLNTGYALPADATIIVNLLIGTQHNVPPELEEALLSNPVQTNGAGVL